MNEDVEGGGGSWCHHYARITNFYANPKKSRKTKQTSKYFLWNLFGWKFFQAKKKNKIKQAWKTLNTISQEEMNPGWWGWSSSVWNKWIFYSNYYFREEKKRKLNILMLLFCCFTICIHSHLQKTWLKFDPKNYVFSLNNKHMMMWC